MPCYDIMGVHICQITAIVSRPPIVISTKHRKQWLVLDDTWPMKTDTVLNYPIHETQKCPPEQITTEPCFVWLVLVYVHTWLKSVRIHAPYRDAGLSLIYDMIYAHSTPHMYAQDFRIPPKRPKTHKMRLIWLVYDIQGLCMACH